MGISGHSDIFRGEEGKLWLILPRGLLMFVGMNAMHLAKAKEERNTNVFLIVTIVCLQNCEQLYVVRPFLVARKNENETERTFRFGNFSLKSHLAADNEIEPKLPKKQ